MNNGEPYDQSAYLERRFHRDRHHLTVGTSALHAADPAEMAMRMEEAQADPGIQVTRERDRMRSEIFSGFAEYLFADGAAPDAVLARIDGFIRSFDPRTLARIRGPKDTVEWVKPKQVSMVLRKNCRALRAAREAASSRGALSTWCRQMDQELDQDQVRQMIVGLIILLFDAGSKWRHLVATAYCLAKALRPHLIGSMSLEHIAVLSGDKGRATVQNRIKRIYNLRLQKAGALGNRVHFQKSATASRNYSAAQKGNRNRVKNRKGKGKV